MTDYIQAYTRFYYNIEHGFPTFLMVNRHTTYCGVLQGPQVEN
jgi:hypothetical protein